MTPMELRLRPADWLAAWRPVRGRLLLPVPIPPKLSARVAVRVQLVGHPACATVLGSAVSVQRDGGQFRVELAPEQESLRAIALLSAASSGQPVRFRERAPRYLVRLPVIVPSVGGQVFTSTLSISEGGCSLQWSGPTLRVGQTLALRSGAGSRVASLRGLVRWAETRGESTRAGIRLVVEPGQVWRGFLEEAARTGAARG